ncbi:MFS general substrate transporter [Delitschia confertaspora ATCC 74209]|uniref:MFS general substrate transporter n=1 Tax=Delitschia confertaspora ATCC 74209 TaxID=1513339 RepID=A0A9P4JCM4_9PLEO|nr:MFS general substrate transporter [Delitschia confertaspora ATCC 74209]
MAFNPAEARRDEEKTSPLSQIPTADEPKPDALTERLNTDDSEGQYSRLAEKDSVGKKILQEAEVYDQLGFGFPTWKKWGILTVVFLVQVSMNFNTSLYSNAIGGISKEFSVSEQAARVGAAVFLVTYAFGCELWAPWSEEIGRVPVIQASLFLVNVFQIPVAIAPNFATIIAGRALGGISSAGGSVTLGMVADMWDADTQQYAVAYVVFSSVGGSVLGPIIGGFVEEYLAWRWCIWIQLIFGVAVQLLHLLCVSETRATILVDRIAKQRRKEAAKNGVELDLWGPTENKNLKDYFKWGQIMELWSRPFRMFLTEPIVLCLSLLSGFSDALIFMFLQSYGLVYRQWGFGNVALGLAFIPIGIGYLIGYISFIPAIRRNIALRATRKDGRAQFESRLWWLLYTAPCLPIGLIGFAWTSNNPQIHWIAPLIFSTVIGIANYAIYMATIDYMVAAYGPYSASATGGNGWARDFLAGVLTLPAVPFYQNIGGKNHLAYASTILFVIAFFLVAAVYIIYWKGPVLRRRSPFAQKVGAEQQKMGGKRAMSVDDPMRPGSYGSAPSSLSRNLF